MVALRADLSPWETWADDWTSLATVLQGIGTALTTLIALVTVIYAARQVHLARDLREDQARPFVTVAFRPSHTLVCNIVIKNEGTTLASDVLFRFTPEWESSEPQRNEIKNSKLWREGIPTLVPGQEISIFADMFNKRYERADLPRAYDVEVRFAGREPSRRGGQAGKVRNYALTYRLDIDIFYGYSHAGVYGVHEVADALRKIDQRLGGWSEHPGGPLRVLTRDGDARDREEVAEYEEYRARGAGPTATASDVVPVQQLSADFVAQQPIDRPPSITNPHTAEDSSDDG